MALARDIMSTAVVELERTRTVAEACRVMRERQLGSVIVGASGFPVGIVTETDVVRLIAAGGDPARTRLDAVMSSPLYSTTPESDVMRAAATMNANHIKKMPVIERQRVAGIITQTDIVRYALVAITELQRAYNAGELSANEFSMRSQELLGMPHLKDAARHWHMRCRSCGYRFLAEERKDGHLSVERCERCGGPVAYDPAPPM